LPCGGICGRSPVQESMLIAKHPHSASCRQRRWASGVPGHHHGGSVVSVVWREL
jgi:hypothetical protein